MGVELVLVLALECSLVEVQVDCDFFVLFELHDNERVSRLTLAQRRVETDTQHAVHLVGLRKNHEFLDGVVLDLVVVCFTAESKRCLVHVDIETASVRR